MQINTVCKNVANFRRDFHSGTSSLRFPLVALYSFTWYKHKISYQSESYRCEFTPVTVPGRDFHSGSKTHSDVMLTRFGCSLQHETTLLGVCILVPRAPTFLFKLLNEGLWDHPKISFFSLAVQNLMRNKVKSATLLRIALYFRWDAWNRAI